MARSKGRRRGDSTSSEGSNHGEPPPATEELKQGRRSRGSKGQGKASKGGGGAKPRLSASTFVHMDVDPERIRFAHSKIRPVFSGCGRRLEDTLEAIRVGSTKVSDLPTITVIEGPADEGEAWYFSLNNRRLWVLKACKREGLLHGGVVRVRVRGPKDHEVERYTLDRCSNSAKFLREHTSAGDCDAGGEGEGDGRSCCDDAQGDGGEAAGRGAGGTEASSLPGT